MKAITFKNIRIVIMLSLLALVAIYTQDQRVNTTSWYQPIEVTIFPINGDGSAKIFTFLPSRESTAKEINWISAP